MIATVELFNFQSHKHTLFEFDKGLNVLSGSSGNGKSAIRRAIQWVITNKPTGTSHVSWWACNSKGKQIEDTRVILTMVDGTTVERLRSATKNCYIVNGTVLEAVGSDIPDQVSEALRFSDINYQNQLEAPFLISQSASEVARYFNRIVKLEDADYYQSAIESKRRKCNAEIESTAKNIASLTTELNTFDWVEKAEERIKRILILETDIDIITKDIEDMSNSILLYKKENNKLDTCAIVYDAQEMLDTCDKLQARGQQISTLIETLEASLDKYHIYQKDVSQKDIIDEGSRIINKCNRFLSGIEESKIDITTLSSSIRKYEEMTELSDTVASELRIATTELKLVSICPLCGNRMHDDKVVF